MGGFLGIGKSSQEKALEEQKRQAAAEADRNRRAQEVRQAERIANKGQETANIQLGEGAEEEVLDPNKKRKNIVSKTNSSVAPSLGLGGVKKGKKKNTGIQV